MSARRRTAGSVVALVVLVAAFTAGCRPYFAWPGHGNGNGNGSGKAVTIVDTGVSPKMSPGTLVDRPVLVSNPNGHAVKLQGITAVVGTPVGTGGTIPNGCPAGSVTVTPPTTLPDVAGKGSSQIVLSARMSADAPDSCKNTTFPLTYSVKASKK